MPGHAAVAILISKSSRNQSPSPLLPKWHSYLQPGNLILTERSQHLIVNRQVLHGIIYLSILSSHHPRSNTSQHPCLVMCHHQPRELMDTVMSATGYIVIHWNQYIKYIDRSSGNEGQMCRGCFWPDRECECSPFSQM
jgi:hypothetical protein